LPTETSIRVLDSPDVGEDGVAELGRTGLLLHGYGDGLTLVAPTAAGGDRQQRQPQRACHAGITPAGGSRFDEGGAFRVHDLEGRARRRPVAIFDI
jgi:hypothetical protein